MTTNEKANYERSYASQWSEIYRLRAARDAATNAHDLARELVLSLQHDLGNGLRLGELSFRIYERLADRLNIKLQSLSGEQQT